MTWANEIINGQNKIINGQNEIIIGQNEIINGQNQIINGLNDITIGLNDQIKIHSHGILFCVQSTKDSFMLEYHARLTCELPYLGSYKVPIQCN